MAEFLILCPVHGGTYINHLFHNSQISQRSVIRWMRRNTPNFDTSKQIKSLSFVGRLPVFSRSENREFLRSVALGAVEPVSLSLFAFSFVLWLDRLRLFRSTMYVLGLQADVCCLRDQLR